MLRKILMSIAIVGGLSGCTTIYADSAPASNGGQFVSGSSGAERAMFYCPAEKTESCKQIEVELK